MPSAYGGNNHGSIVEISSEWYIFYHRQTNGTWYSRQGCAEKLHLAEDGSFRQVELTSCGLNGGSLVGRGNTRLILHAICLQRRRAFLMQTRDFQE